MEFYVVVFIFISCMIALALLIYYCQERRSSKYSFANNQRSVSTIALSIAAPGFLDETYFPKSCPGNVRSTEPPPPGFKICNDKTEKALRNNHNCNNLKVIQPHKCSAVPDDQFSDSDSSTSSKIYFAPNTAAYSVAKRESATAAVVKCMSKIPPNNNEITKNKCQNASRENNLPHNFTIQNERRENLKGNVSNTIQNNNDINKRESGQIRDFLKISADTKFEKQNLIKQKIEECKTKSSNDKLEMYPEELHDQFLETVELDPVEEVSEVSTIIITN